MKGIDMIKIVTSVLAEFDLEELISLGAPEDEYFPEAVYIVNNMCNEFNKYEELEELVLADIIQQAFLTQFNKLVSVPECVTIAEGIMNKLNM